MANVSAAKKLKELGYEFQPGMKVSWVVTDSRKTPQEVEPYISGRKFSAVPDYRYYAGRLANTISRVTDVFGWDEKSLLSGAQQKDLFSDWGPEPKEKKRKDKVKTSGEPKKLEDFF